MEEKKNRKAAMDLAVGVFFVIFGLYVTITSLNMKVYNTFIDAPGFFPMIIGIVITALGAVLALIGVRTGGVAELKEVLTGTFLKAFITNESTVRVLVLLAMMAVYIYVFVGRIHFIIATSIYLTANFLYLKACKTWWMAVIIAVITSVVSYYAFLFGFGIILP